MPPRLHSVTRSATQIHCRPGTAIRASLATSTAIASTRSATSLDPTLLATIPDAPVPFPVAPPPHALQATIAKVADQASHPVRKHAVLASLVLTRAAPYSAKDLTAIRTRAFAIEAATKSKGRADGAVKRSGLKTLDAMIHFARCGTTGRCDPSIATLARLSLQAPSTVVDAIKRLEALGLIKATRRWFKAFCKVANQVVSRQITTSYTLCVEAIYHTPIPAPLPAVYRRVLRTPVDTLLHHGRSMRSGIKRLSRALRTLASPSTSTASGEDIVCTPLFQALPA